MLCHLLSVGARSWATPYATWAAEGFAVGLPRFVVGRVVASAGVPSQAGDDDGVERGDGLAVASAVEPVALGPAPGRSLASQLESVIFNPDATSRT
jgi:hypothetical protein